MATFKQYTASGGASEAFSIKTFTSDEIKVRVDGALKTAGTHYNITSYTANGGTVTWISPHAPSSGTVRIYRITDLDPAQATYSAGSSVKAGDLNNNQTQVLRGLEEENDQLIQTWDIEDKAVTAAKIKEGTARQVLQTNAGGTATEWTSNVDLPGTLDVTGATDLDGTLNVDGATTLNGTTVDGILDVNGSATVDNIQFNGNEIDTTSGNLTIDSAGGTTVIDDALTVSGGATLSSTLDVTSNTSVGGTFSVTGATTLTGALDANGGASIDNIRIGVTGDNEIDTSSGNLTIDSSGGTTTIDDALTVSGNATLQGTLGVTGTSTLSNITGAAIVTSGTSSSDTKVYSAKRSDEVYFNVDSGETIKSGDTWSGADTKIATTKAIDNRVVDLIDEVGGFLPILNEGAIPATHPEAANETTADRVGTIISIGVIAKSGGYTPSSGTVTIPASELTNHSVNATITNCGTTALSEGFGVLVETTAQTDSQYAAGPSFKFHRLVPKATEVTTVASKATEIGRLGTAAAVEDMAILGTTDCVADMAILGTADVVSDLNTLGTADVVSDLNTLGTSAVVSNLDTCATNVANINSVGGNITNVNAVASNINSVHDFADLYQVKTSAPTARADSSSLEVGDLWFDSSSNKQMMVRDGSSGDGYSAMSPSQSTLDDIAIVSGNITYTEDLGLITDSVSTGTGNSIETCADNIANIQRLGTADAVADMNVLGTADVVADLNTLGTADVVADLNTLGTADCVSDMNTLATSSNVTNMNTLAGIQGNITTVAGISSNVTTVANNNANVTAVAGKATEIGRLGTADAVADMAILGTTDVVADLNTLATADVVADLNTLGTADVVSDMNTLGTSSNVTNMNTLAGISGNITTVAGISSNVTSVAGNATNINAVAGNATNINAVAADATDIGAVAGKATEIGRLGTAAAVADLAILGTTDVVADMNTLATADIVSDMNTLAVTDVVNDMNTLATSSNVTNMNTVAGSISNVNTVAGSQSNVNTVASSIADVNRYANEYKIASSAPGSPSEGDLWYDSTNNVLKYRDDNSWESIAAGIANIDEDTSPSLGGHLDANSKNITNGGTATFSSFVGALTGNASGSSGSCTGNAATATILATARTIGGVSFNGSANINLPGVNAAGNQNTSGTAAGLSGSPNISVGTISGTNLQLDFGTL